jgi:hypothetical protein
LRAERDFQAWDVVSFPAADGGAVRLGVVAAIRDGTVTLDPLIYQQLTGTT